MFDETDAQPESHPVDEVEIGRDQVGQQVVLVAQSLCPESMDVCLRDRPKRYGELALVFGQRQVDRALRRFPAYRTPPSILKDVR